MAAIGRRSDSNDVSLLLGPVIRLEAVRGGLNVSIEGHFNFLKEFEPQSVVGHRVDSHKALPYVTTRFEPLCVKIHAVVTLVGEYGKYKSKN